MNAKRKPKNADEPLIEEDVKSAPEIKASKALVFISHDSRDADLAEAFANLLSDVSAGTLKSFRSSDRKGTAGIEFGAEWYRSIMAQLDDATDVVALLTSRSLDRPWILYEAGVAKGKLATTVFGVALGVPLDKVSTGPFGQFQNCGDDEDSLTKLIMQLLARNPDASPREAAIRRQVQSFKESVTKILTALGDDDDDSPPTDDQNAAKLFEEVKAMVLDLPERIDYTLGSLGSRERSPSRKFHSRMIEELVHGSMFERSEQGPGLAVLVTFSMLREHYPWIYEPGMEFYRAVRSKKIPAAQSAAKELLEVAEATRRYKVFHRLTEGEESHFLLRRMPELVEQLVYRTMSEMEKRPKRT